MKFPKLFRQKRLRGKSKSPEAKFREKKAQVDSYLLDAWLRKLKDDPTLTDRMSEQKYGSEVGMARYDSEGESGYESPDLLEVLRQAREAKDLLKDEISEGKGSWLHDIAEIAKALPSFLAALPQIQHAVQQQQKTQAVTQYLHAQQTPAQLAEANAQAQEQAQTQARAKLQAEADAQVLVQSQIQSIETNFDQSMEVLVPLSEFEPADVWKMLNETGEVAWMQYLSHTTLEQLEESLEMLANNCADDNKAKQIREFVANKHHWLGQLVEIAHNAAQNTG